MPVAAAAPGSSDASALVSSRLSGDGVDATGVVDGDAQCEVARRYGVTTPAATRGRGAMMSLAAAAAAQCCIDIARDFGVRVCTNRDAPEVSVPSLRGMVTRRLSSTVA